LQKGDASAAESHRPSPYHPDPPIASRYSSSIPKKSERVAAIHAGWRGYARPASPKKAVGPHAIRIRQQSPLILLAAIGPSIGPCCFTKSACRLRNQIHRAIRRRCRLFRRALAPVKKPNPPPVAQHESLRAHQPASKKTSHLDLRKAKPARKLLTAGPPGQKISSSAISAPPATPVSPSSSHRREGPLCRAASCPPIGLRPTRKNVSGVILRLSDEDSLKGPPTQNSSENSCPAPVCSIPQTQYCQRRSRPLHFP